jgi:hypothetical protein|tara:strand:+ start:261 stop:419 length:159 start_codon:yes stop_codon:yes gene_type:complete
MTVTGSGHCSGNPPAKLIICRKFRIIFLMALGSKNEEVQEEGKSKIKLGAVV